MNYINWRRQLSRALTQQGRAAAHDILSQPQAAATSQRIGFTGPPGAGKSSLIAKLAEGRLKRQRRIGVLAIDPSSPVSGGSLLGDRLRMDGIQDPEHLYIRSVPSGPCHDGLCRNAAGLLNVMEQYAFDDLFLETVGVGQVSYSARVLVDTLVLVLVPESGDTVQAMKAGIIEIADLYVINKAETPAAHRLAVELKSVIDRPHLRRKSAPEVILTSALKNLGFEELDKAIDRHYVRSGAKGQKQTRMRERQFYQLRALIAQQVDEALHAMPAD